MPVVTAVANSMTRPLPPIISPRVHAVTDYLVIGSFLVAGLLFRRRNRRASFGAFLCAGAQLATSLLTAYPGGIAPVISFQDHGKIDIGLAAMMATMPEFLAFSDRSERKFFLREAGVVTALTNLTDFRPRFVRSVSRNSRRSFV